ncbi:MAG: NAD(P)H-dependent oxidoreductase subunit E, partial [Dehalococcoidia bacterium]|nr:NAD(P)H-dependent oxidoreductase subunit E [Dehalococcoidia bacterium]
MEARLNNECKILVCQSTGCESSKSDKITQALETQIKQLELSKNVQVKFTGCHGFCQQGPIVIVEPEGVFYTQVKEEDVPEILKSHIVDRKYVERLFYHNPVTGEAISLYKDVPFYSRQQRLILRNCGHINPEKIDDYLATGGYAALKKA